MYEAPRADLGRYLCVLVATRAGMCDMLCAVAVVRDECARSTVLGSCRCVRQRVRMGATAGRGVMWSTADTLVMYGVPRVHVGQPLSA